MNGHGNSFQNLNPHHLYAIKDEVENDVFKYGITDDPIQADGLSKRLRNQIDLLNRAVGWTRFVGTVLVKNIQGRKEAKSIEDEFIDNYIDLHDRRPRGNPTGGSKNKLK